MALPPLLKRRKGDTPEPRPSGVSDASELQARTRARRRLIGAAVLLVAGVIAFPLLFETQPRPLPVDIPMVIPAREGAAPLEVPARTPRATSGTISDSAASAAPPAAAASPSTTATAPAPVEPPAAPAAPVQPPAEARTPAPGAAKPDAVKRPAPPPKAAETTSARAREPKPPAPKPGAEPAPKPAGQPKADGRFVVQVAAYADDASASAARQRIERLGLKTYTQEVQVRGERRIRVRIGPFESRAEANKALETLKAGNLPGVVLTL